MQQYTAAEELLPISNNHFGEIISQSTDTLVDRLAIELPLVSLPIRFTAFCPFEEAIKNAVRLTTLAKNL